jgi:hypothetical protein
VGRVGSMGRSFGEQSLGLEGAQSQFAHPNDDQITPSWFVVLDLKSGTSMRREVGLILVRIELNSFVSV